MSTIRCLIVVSSGITCPFGQLSQSPGYISDSLLTRSPLCIATPYDLHVLATPPAFRLSQDQTLQLNFLARAVPDARCGPFGLTETDSFRSDVYPRNEFVQTDRVKTLLGQLLLPPCRLGQRGQSNRLRPNPPFGRLKTQRLEQGSNISSGCPGPRRPGTTHK